MGGTVGVAIAGLAGCIGTQGGPGAEGTAEDDHPGHAEEEHGHEMVSEPRQSREVIVNTARDGDTTEYHFDPHVTWVSVGGTVKWELESGTHTATAYHPGNDQPRLVPERTDAWDSGTMSETGETFERTFDTEGVYHYLCTPHEEFGMIATVVVGKPHVEDQRAVQAMPEDKPEEVHGKLEELNSMVREMMGDGHHDDEDGHHDDETTHHGEDGHHDDETTHHGEDGHHDDETTHDD